MTIKTMKLARVSLVSILKICLRHKRHSVMQCEWMRLFRKTISTHTRESFVWFHFKGNENSLFFSFGVFFSYVLVLSFQSLRFLLPQILVVAIIEIDLSLFRTSFLLFRKMPLMPPPPQSSVSPFRFVSLLLWATEWFVVVVEPNGAVDSLCNISGCLRNTKYIPSKCMTGLIAAYDNASVASQGGFPFFDIIDWYSANTSSMIAIIFFPDPIVCTLFGMLFYYGLLPICLGKWRTPATNTARNPCSIRDVVKEYPPARRWSIR